MSVVPARCGTKIIIPLLRSCPWVPNCIKLEILAIMQSFPRRLPFFVRSLDVTKVWLDLLHLQLSSTIHRSLRGNTVLLGFIGKGLDLVLKRVSAPYPMVCLLSKTTYDKQWHGRRFISVALKVERAHHSVSLRRNDSKSSLVLRDVLSHTWGCNYFRILSL